MTDMYVMKTRSCTSESETISEIEKW